MQPGLTLVPAKQPADCNAPGYIDRAIFSLAATIAQLPADVERAADSSPLPEQPDQAFIDDLVVRAYRDRVLRPL